MAESRKIINSYSLLKSGSLLMLAFINLLTVSCAETTRPGTNYLTNHSSKNLFVSVVSKADANPFYTRLPTNSGRVLVTDSEATTSGSNLHVPAGHHLYSVEMIKTSVETLKNELFREERIVLFFAQNDQEAVSIAGKAEEFAHPLKVDVSQLNRPSIYLDAESMPALSLDDMNPNQLQSIPQGGIVIDTARMREDLESLSGARPTVVNGQSVTIVNRATEANKILARAWLRASYEELGFTVTEHKYATGTNLIAEKRAANPADDQIFLVSGHLDTVNTAGADDDGSGVISGLSIARAIHGLEFKRTIRFVAFDEEERGLIGSAAYAKELDRVGDISKVSLFNIEMTGYDIDNDGKFHSIDCNENTSAALTNALISSILAEGIKLTKVEACTTRSDHAVFWKHNRPAIVMSQNFFGGDSNPCYHRMCDTVGIVNWDYMAKMTQAAGNAVAILNR